MSQKTCLVKSNRGCSGASVREDVQTVFFSAFLLLSGGLVSAPADTLSTATVIADKGVTVSRTDTVKLGRSKASQSVADVLLLTPGLLLSDYGGYAGLKNVSLRGLGSPHTSICIDGVKVSNVQSGQADLGMLEIENCGEAVIDYAQNSVNFTTLRPELGGRSFAGSAGIDGGSFGTWLPRARMDFRLPGSCVLSTHASGVVSRGDFLYGDGQVRENNDIAQLKAGADLFGVTGGGDWMLKAYFNDAVRGVPGSSDWPSLDRQSDRNLFVQGILRQAVNERNLLNISFKASRDRLVYESEWGDTDGEQSEFQINVSDRFRAGRHWELSVSAGAVRDLMNSTEYEAGRSAMTGIAGVSFKSGGFFADAALQYDGVFDAVPDAESGGARNLTSNTLSPSLDLRKTLRKGLDLTGFARRAYRTPTFNELYYPGYGNPKLLPEDAWLFDLGADWSAHVCKNLTFKAKADAFVNSLENKIISAPTPDNSSVWLPYNIGEVLLRGVDADAKLEYVAEGWKGAFGARYSFQDADNVPYLSRHSAVVTANVNCRGWSADAVWTLRAGRRDSYGEMPDWNTLDLAVSKRIAIRSSCVISFRVGCRNLTDTRHCLVSGYPMPGRSLLAGAFVNL